jgi:hypothetical protein
MQKKERKMNEVYIKAYHPTKNYQNRFSLFREIKVTKIGNNNNNNQSIIATAIKKVVRLPQLRTDE